MAALARCISAIPNLAAESKKIVDFGFQHVRTKFLGAWMLRDMKRRKICKEHAVERIRLLALKRNNILPREIIEIAVKEFDEKIPRQTALRQLTNRCVFTSKPRGVVQRWRLSRLVFRHLVDYNKTAGVQRAMW